MENNNAEGIFQNRSPVDRRRARNRRSFLKQKHLDHAPERRVNMIKRRILGDRREWFSEVIDTFWREDH